MEAAAPAAPSPYSLAILLGLNRTEKHVYPGAETAEERAIRRRQARRNRGTVTPGRAGRRLVAQADRAQGRALARAARRADA